MPWRRAMPCTLGRSVGGRGGSTWAGRRRDIRSAPCRCGRKRVAYLDNLKVLLVAVIIAAHGVGAYSWLDGAWPYQEVREVRLTGGRRHRPQRAAIPGLLFVMGLFFLISGLVTPVRSQRKGPRQFTRDRIVRLGIPLAVWVLGIWPALVYAIHRAAGEHYSYWRGFMHADPFLDPGPMWFVEVLLIYSLGYAVWRQWRAHHAAPFAAQSGPHRGWARSAARTRTLVLLAAGTSLATILVRPVFPFMSAQIGQLKLWQWPEYLATVRAGHRRGPARLA